MPRILVLEPNAELQALYVRFVRKFGYEAATTVDERDPDAVVFEPADLGALAAVKALRARHAELPLICASIHPPSGETRALGPAEYLVKPFGGSELRDVLERALDGRPAA